MSTSFNIDPSSVSPEQIKSDLEAFLDTKPDAAKWEGFFSSQAGQTVVELIAGLGAFNRYNNIVARRENNIQYSQNRSSIIAGDQRSGYSVYRGRNKILDITITANTTVTLSAFTIVGSIKDKDMVLMEDAVLNSGENVTLKVAVGELKSEELTAPSDASSLFRFTENKVSEDIRLLLNGTEVEISDRMVDLINEKFVAISNVLGSVDIMYLNLDTFVVKYTTGDILRLEWVEHKDTEFITSDISPIYGDLVSYLEDESFNDEETDESARINGPLYQETQFVIRGRKDYMKIFRLLDPSNILDTSYTDITPAVVELYYVKECLDIYSSSEKDDFVTQLASSRSMGLQPPTIADPTIVFLDFTATLKLILGETGDPTTDAETIFSAYEKDLEASMDFQDVEKAFTDLVYVKVARIAVTGNTWEASENYRRGTHVEPVTPNDFLYENSRKLYLSDGTEPTWPGTLEDTIQDGKLIWEVVAQGLCESLDEWQADTHYDIGDEVRAIGVVGGAHKYKVVEQLNYSASIYEQQRIGFSAIPASGTWRMELGECETADLAWNADAAAVQAAINATDCFSDVEVSGDYVAGFLLEFKGADANKPQEEATFDNTGVNETHCINFDIVPNSGNWKLDFNGQVTASLAYDISAANLKSALEALSTIGSGNVEVDDTQDDTYRVRYIGSLQKQPVPHILVEDTNNLISAADVSAVVTATTEGRVVSAGVNEIQILNFTLVPDIGIDEIQKITFDQVPDAGNWSLTFESQTTSSMVYNANAAAVEAALEALSTIGSGNVTVSGDYSAGFTITFVGDLEETDVTQITLASSTLTKTAAAVVVTISTTTQGYDPGRWSIEFDGKTTDLLESNASAATIESALEALSTIGSGNVTVSGSYASDFTVTFIGALQKTDVVLMTIPHNTLYSGGQAVDIDPIEDTKGSGPDAGEDEVQDVDFAYPPDSGLFKLSYNAEETAAINWNDNAAAVQTALNALPSLSAVVVAGDFTAGFTITFQGADGKINHPLLTVSENSLHTSTATVVITITECVVGKYPANNVKDGGSNPITITPTTLVDAYDPEPDWPGIEGGC
jgi:hypothetical protein